VRLAAPWRGVPAPTGSWLCGNDPGGGTQSNAEKIRRVMESGGTGARMPTHNAEQTTLAKRLVYCIESKAAYQDEATGRNGPAASTRGKRGWPSS